MGNESEQEEYDWDVILSYDTIKEVRVLDRRLGLIYYAVLLMVLFYIIIYCLIIKRQYLAFEKTNGFMMTKVLHTAFANSTAEAGIPFDGFEALTNPGESSALFIPTRIVVTRGQGQASECAQPAFSCSSDADCDTGESVVKTPKCDQGMCVRRGWCPPEQPGAPQTEVHRIKAEDFDIWFQGKVQYHIFTVLDPNTGLMKGLASSNMNEKEPTFSPDVGANTYQMSYILKKANIDIDTIWEDGAVVIITAAFDCNLDATADACTMLVMGTTVDVANGYNYKVTKYYDEGGERKRNLFHYYGIRLVIFSVGFGFRADVTQIVLVISQAIALLSCAGTAADVFLQNVVPERKHYNARKVIQTEDFGDEK